MNAVELIERKCDRAALTDDQIRWFITGVAAGTIPDYQAAAMLMAVFINGMDDDELATWTDAMLHSGEVLDLSLIEAPKADKHSTGGVGDKVSIPLAPIVAACGVAVPMMSGRGLGHTGGTLDKLESIPGFTAALDPDRFHQVLAAEGLVLAGQSDTLVPADRRLYALRDATGTVTSIPLIASSIMSKKLAEDLDALVLDVKVGSGAFMGDLERARLLAKTMVGLGAAHGLTVEAVLTDMSQPLGLEVGNANEVAESIEVLRGGGPDDLVELVSYLAARMLMAAGATGSPDEAALSVAGVIESGAALDAFRRVVAAQGGDTSVVDDPAGLPSAPEVAEVTAERDGWVTLCDARTVGVSAMRLGAGRERKEDEVDHGVGITLLAKVGDRVELGQPVAKVRYRSLERWDETAPFLAGAWQIDDEATAPGPLVIERVG
ncbi:MAG TPA: thymidine phosphorylase [Acidimicrobiia bacterium]|nr:thymidine phosphorylase [Acidimicrobiia bacterium]